ncbi:MAG: DMT family transporter [Oligoflexus sp.]|nr:DMT family transporter [Oligoflexus sp.]
MLLTRDGPVASNLSSSLSSSPKNQDATAIAAGDGGDHPIQALLFMILAQFLFSTNVFLLRVTERVEIATSGEVFHLTAWEPMFYRSIALSLWCLYRLRKDPGEKPSSKESFWLWARGIIGVLSLTTYYYGVLHIPLGMASLFSNSSPLYVTVLAIVISGEVVHRLRLVTVVFGFLGIGLVAWGALQHAGAIAGFDVMIAALSGPLAALAYFSIRQLKRIKSEQIMLSLGLGGSIVSGVVLAFKGWHLPSSLAGQGVLILSVLPAVFAQYCLTRAFRSAPASQVSPLQYMGPLFSTAYGALFLKESMPSVAAFGVAVVLVFGLIIPYGEALLARKRATM